MTFRVESFRDDPLFWFNKETNTGLQEANIPADREVGDQAEILAQENPDHELVYNEFKDLASRMASIVERFPGLCRDAGRDLERVHAKYHAIAAGEIHERLELQRWGNEHEGPHTPRR